MEFIFAKECSEVVDRFSIGKRGANPSKNDSTDFNQFAGSTGSTLASWQFFSSTPISQRIDVPLAAFAWAASRSAALRGSSHKDFNSTLESSIR